MKPPLFSAIKSSREWQNSDNFAGCFACIPSPRTMPLGKMVTRLVQNGWNSATDPLYIKKKNKEGETVTFRCREIYHGSAALLDLKIHKHMTRRVTRFKTKKEKCKLLTIVS